MIDQAPIQRVLKKKLDESRERNPSYSLRAFSRKLGIHSAALSEILRGKRRISVKIARRILGGIELTPQERSEVLGCFPGALAPTTRSPDVDPLEHFSSWPHRAILSLTETQGFRSDLEWISRRLDLSKNVCEMAIERLVRLNLLVREADGMLRASRSQCPPLDDASGQRDITAITMAIDPALLPQAQEMIHAFVEQLRAFLESGEKKEVYSFLGELIPLSREASH